MSQQKLLIIVLVTRILCLAFRVAIFPEPFGALAKLGAPSASSLAEAKVQHAAAVLIEHVMSRIGDSNVRLHDAWQLISFSKKPRCVTQEVSSDVCPANLRFQKEGARVTLSFAASRQLLGIGGHNLAKRSELSRHARFLNTLPTWNFLGMLGRLQQRLVPWCTEDVKRAVHSPHCRIYPEGISETCCMRTYVPNAVLLQSNKSQLLNWQESAFWPACKETAPARGGERNKVQFGVLDTVACLDLTAFLI